MKDREIVCIHYKCEGQCDLGKEGTFRHYCQKCSTYKKRPRTRPARVDTRRRKLDRIQKKENRKGEW